MGDSFVNGGKLISVPTFDVIYDQMHRVSLNSGVRALACVGGYSYTPSLVLPQARFVEMCSVSNLEEWGKRGRGGEEEGDKAQAYVLYTPSL